MFQASRGGAKPKMVPASTDIFINMNGSRKSGMYELSGKRDILARRVELPGWLTEVIRGSSDTLVAVLEASHYPVIDIQESRGHVFMRPPRNLFECPAVGLDMTVYDRLSVEATIQEVKFYVYATGYQLVGVWAIQADEFIRQAKLVQTKASFAPQMMVPLTALCNCRIPTLH